MKKLTSYRNNDTVRHIIQECLTKSKDKPFDQYILVCDDPQIIEEVCLQYTNTLFNITPCSFEQAMMELLQYNHHYQKKISDLEARFLIRDLLDKEPDCVFSSTLASSKELFLIFKELSLLEIVETTISNKKVDTVLSLYKKFLDAIPSNQYFQILDCFNQVKIPNNTHYIFLSDQILYPKTMNFITKIDSLQEVIIYIPYHKDNTMSSVYDDYCKEEISFSSDDLTNQLFSNQTVKLPGDHNFYLLPQTTPSYEVQAVISHIDNQIQTEGLQYSDFSIYYPDSTYASLLQETLDLFTMPYNQVLSNNDDQLLLTILLFLEYAQTNKEQDLLNFLDTNVIFVPKLDAYKKQYQAYHKIEDEDYVLIKQQLAPYIQAISTSNTFSDYSAILSALIKEEFQNNIRNTSLLKKIQSYQLPYPLTLQEYISLVQELSISMPKEKTKKDHIHLFSSTNPSAGYVNSKYQYILGNNETVFPSLRKDVGYLLNKERETIPLLDTTYLKSKREISRIISMFSYLPQKTILSYSISSTNGDELLKSTLLKQLTTIYKIPTIDSHELLIHPKLAHHYFITNQIDKDFSISKHITDFIDSKNQPKNVTSIAPKTLSPSQLEVYNGCPHKYFYQHFIGVRPNDQWTLQSNQIGSLVHHLLEINKDLFLSRQDVRSTTLEHIVETLKIQIDQYILEDRTLSKIASIPQNSFFLQMIPYDISVIIHVLRIHMMAGNYKIEETEKRLLQDLDKYTLKGFVDRIDKVDNYIKVMDYKSSNKELDISLAMQGFNIQMLIYMDMLVKQTGNLPGAILYFNTKKKVLKAEDILEETSFDEFLEEYKMQGYVHPNTLSDIDDFEKTSAIVKAKYVKSRNAYEGNLIDDENFSHLIEHIEKHIGTIYEEMVAGNISISPKRSHNSTVDMSINPCKYCNYRSLCRYDLFYNENVMIEKEDINVNEIGGVDDEA